MGIETGPKFGRRYNTLRPRRNGQHFADDIFKRGFFDENAWISINISPKFVPKGPINNIPALFQIMAWHRPGDKPLSEQMMVSLPTHIYASLGHNKLTRLIRSWIFHKSAGHQIRYSRVCCSLGFLYVNKQVSSAYQMWKLLKYFMK